MILIADSGSTKTDWRWVDRDKSIHAITTQGINPNHHGKEAIQNIIQTELLSQTKGLIQPKNIFFYGAGCGSEEKNKLVKSVLSEYFKDAEILVANDLLGAAKALCGDDQGIVAILGTGSNTCFYNGNGIAEHIGGWGYILGDEGSGAHLGMTFMKDYLNDEVPESIKKKFDTSFQLSTDTIVDSVYKKPMPNRFFASFSKFIHENISEEYMKNLVKNCFRLFWEKHICKYPAEKTTNINFVGSIAFHFKDLLKETAQHYHFSINNIMKAPINSLVDYHLKTTSI